MNMNMNAAHARRVLHNDAQRVAFASVRYIPAEVDDSVLNFRVYAGARRPGLLVYLRRDAPANLRIRNGGNGFPGKKLLKCTQQIGAADNADEPSLFEYEQPFDAPSFHERHESGKGAVDRH